MLSFVSGAAGIFLVIGLLAVFLAFKQVPQGFNYTVTRLGRYNRTLLPGLNFIIPFIEATEKWSMQERVLDIPTQTVITKDNASVNTDAIVLFQIIDPASAAYEVKNLEYAMAQLVMSQLRAVLGTLDLDESLSQRDRINTEVQSKVSEAAQRWGVRINTIEVKDLAPPADMIESMEQVMKAEREKRAAITQAEGKKQADIRKAQGAKQASIEIAEGKKRAAELAADAELYTAQKAADARKVEAAAETQAVHQVSQAITQGNPMAVQYFISQKYMEALGELSASNNNKVTILPMEFGGLAGAVQGVSDLLGSNKEKTTA